jgi:D-alanyl-D-alanine carboxypeptidase/D-alanyl-D-alanine-endopeptidase (penicillin-binding protein 4)
MVGIAAGLVALLIAFGAVATLFAVPTVVRSAPELPAPSPISAIHGPARVIGAEAIEACLSGLPSQPPWGSRLALTVADVEGTLLFAQGPTAVIPASTTKLLTAAAVLETLPPGTRFRTTVTWSAADGTLVLVGGGDPYLATRPVDAFIPEVATLAGLARQTTKVLLKAGITSVRLGYDDTLFTGPTVNPAWRPSYVPDNVVSPISALWVEEGRVSAESELRVPDPATAASAAFAGLLRARGIDVEGVGPATGGEEIAAAASAPVDAVVAHMLEVSDNEAAEVLAHHVALSLGDQGSFLGASAAVRGVLEGLGVELTGARLLDASGLSRKNLIPVSAFTEVMALAASGRIPAWGHLLVDLPVSDFTGTLGYRFESVPLVGHGTVRAKTGSLTGVHGFVGYAVTRDGAPLLFVAVADRVPESADDLARLGLDRLATRIAGCSA